MRLHFRDVENAVGCLTPPPGPFNLGNTMYLTQEIAQERQALYGQLVNSYKWTDKVSCFTDKVYFINNYFIVD